MCCLFLFYIDLFGNKIEMKSSSCNSILKKEAQFCFLRKNIYSNYPTHWQFEHMHPSETTKSVS